MKAGLTVLLAVASASVNTHVKVETVNFDEGLLNTEQNIAETFAWKEKKTAEDDSLIDVKLSGLHGCPIQRGDRGGLYFECDVDLTVTSPESTAISTSGGLAPVKVRLIVDMRLPLEHATIEGIVLEKKDAVRIYNELKKKEDECMLTISKTMQAAIVELSKENSGDELIAEKKPSRAVEKKGGGYHHVPPVIS